MSEAQRLAILITADGGALEVALRDLSRQIEDLKGRMGLAGREGESSAKRTASAWENARGKVSGMLDVFGKIGLASMGLSAIKSGIEGIAGAAAGLIQGNAAFETYNTQLATMLGSTDAAQARMAELAAFGASTPFELPGLVEAEKKLIAFRLTGENAMTLTGKSAADLRTVIGDTAAGLGIDFAAMAEQFGKMGTKETFAEALNNLQSWGAVTKDQLKEMGVRFSKSGELLSPVPEAVKAAVALAEQNFGGGMDALSSTFQGKLSTLADTWSELKRTLAAPLFDAMKGGLDLLQPALAGAIEGAKAFGAGFNSDFKGADTLDRLSLGFAGLADALPEGAIKSLAGWLSKLVDPFKGETALERFFDAVRRALDGLGQAVSSLFAGDLGGAMDELGSVLGIPLKILGPLVDMFDAASSAISDFIEGFNLEPDMSFLDRLMNAFGNVSAGAEGVGGFIAKLADGFEAALPGIEAFIAAIAERFQYFKNEILPPVIEFITGTLIPAFADFGQRAAAGLAIVAPYVTSLAAKFMEFGNAVIEKVWPVIRKVLAFIGDHSGVFVTIGAVIAMVAGGPITMLVGALALIGTIVPSVVAWFEGVKAKAAEMGDALGAKVEAIKAWWQQLQADTAAKWQAIKDAIGAAVAAAVAWIQEKFQAARDFVKSIHDGIKGAILAVWNQIPADIRARLVEIYNNVVAKFEAVRAAAVEKWGAIKAAIGDAIGGTVEWIKAQGRLMYENYIQPIVDLVDAVKQRFEEVKAAIVEKVSSMLEPVRQKFAEIKAAIVERVKEIADGVREKFGEVRAAITGKLTETKTAAGEKAREILATLLDPFRNIYADITKVGKDLLDGLRQGISNSWASFKDWFWNRIRSLVGIGRDAVDAHSPSRAFQRIAEDSVAGLYLGFEGLKAVGNWIQQEMVGWVRDKDIENFGSIAALTGHLLEIFTNTTAALKALLAFDVTTSAGQISAQFDALVGTFETALLRMKGLAQYAGRGDSPDSFLNMFDVQNIEIVSKGIQATISMIDGLLGIVDKMATVKLPQAGGIAALLPLLQELGHTAAQFIDSVGTPEGEDATAFFSQGATTAAAIAAWAKAVAEIVGLKVGALASDFAAQMTTLASAAALAWDALKATALDWGRMGVTAREELLVGVKAYAEVVAASMSILKGSAELKIDEATLATTDQIDAAGRVANDGLVKIAEMAGWWVRMPQEAAKAVEGIRAYVDAGTAALGLLKAGADLDVSGATEANYVQLTVAARNAQTAESLVQGFAQGYINNGAAWREKVVPAIKDWADSAKAAMDLLTAGAALAIDKVTAATIGPLDVAGKNAQMALSIVGGMAQGWVNNGTVWREKVVPAIKDWADSAGAALKLLVDAAGVTTDWSKVTAFLHDGLARAGDNASAMLSVVQQLATTWAGASDNAAIGAVAERVKIWADGAGSALRILVDAAGVTTDWAKVQIVSVHNMTIAGVNALLMLRAVSQLADVWAGIAAPEVLRALVDRVKLFAEGAGTALRLIVDIAGLAVDWSKVTLVSASGLDAVGANASLLLAAAERLAADWVSGRSAEDMKATAERIKLWGDSASGAGKAFADAAGSFSALVKAKWPADLSGAIARVGIAMSAVLAEFSDMYDRLRRGGRDLDKAGQISVLVGGAAESVGKVFEAFSLEKLLKNPLVDSKVRSGWASQVAARRLDHLAGKMAEGVRRAVTALVDGLAGVVVPTGLASGLDALVSVYERLLDTLERLSAATLPDASKIAALLAALGYVPGMPGAPAGGGSSSGGQPSMGSPYQPPAPPPSMGPPYQPPAAPGQPSLPPAAPSPGPAPAVTVQLTNEIHLGLEVVARALTLVSNVKAMQTTHAPVGA